MTSLSKARQRQRSIGRLGAAVTVLLLVMFVLSAWYRIAVVPKAGYLRFEITAGGFYCDWTDPATLRKGQTVIYTGPLEFKRHRFQLGLAQWFKGQSSASEGYFSVPGWLILTLVGVPTVWLILRSRGARLGHCTTCGYDLTGNVSGVCPECGLGFERRLPR